MKTLIQKVKEELKKVNLGLEEVKECNDKYIVKILENNKVVFNKWEISKSLQWNKVKSFVDMTKRNVEMSKLIFNNITNER